MAQIHDGESVPEDVVSGTAVDVSHFSGRWEAGGGERRAASDRVTRSRMGRTPFHPRGVEKRDRKTNAEKVIIKYVYVNKVVRAIQGFAAGLKTHGLSLTVLNGVD
jgi:hypothetical protein